MEKKFLLSQDERFAIVIPGNHEETITFAANHFISTGKMAIQDHDHFYVALSGGSTPKAIFEILSKPPYSEMLDWNKVSLFWSDERSVLPTDSDSNYKMAMDAGIENLPIPSAQIHRMIAELTIEENALNYEELIKNTIKDSSFDLIMLGMGADGHTASLFPGTKALDITDRLIVANEVPELNTLRMTMTYPCINRAKNIAVYVLGDSKKELIANILESKEEAKNLPIMKIGTRENKATFVLDENAAKFFLEKSKK